MEGTFVVPCYLNAAGCPPGSRFAYLPGSVGAAAHPGQHAGGELHLPDPARRRRTGRRSTPARPSLYGHGLLGSASEITAGNIKAMANEHNFVFCATDWSGMSTQDMPNIATILGDLSNFASLPDRAQQGFLNFMYLGRADDPPAGLQHQPGVPVHEGRRHRSR